MDFKFVTPELLLKAADELHLPGGGADFMCFAIEEAVQPGVWNQENLPVGVKRVVRNGITIKARHEFCCLLEMHGVPLNGSAFSDCADEKDGKNGARFMFLEFLSYWLEDQESL